MPFYTFKCPSCCIEIEVQQTIKDDPPKCEKCINASVGIHSPLMERVWKPTARPQFKGSGFYETDYKKGKK